MVTLEQTSTRMTTRTCNRPEVLCGGEEFHEMHRQTERQTD